MFRRLAEAFEDSGNAGSSSSSSSHNKYIKGQTSYFNALPNIILSGTSGLKGFDTAIQSVDSNGQGYQQPVVKNPNNIFMQDSSPTLNNLAKQCSSSSIDQLIAMKNPNASIGCGWLYTPPNQGSPYPVVSQGFIGDSVAPLQNFNPVDHKKYYFDLQLAKKQILLDKCKALKACGDVDIDVFKGSCGYCIDTNQGVPIDTVGQSLYGSDPIGSCSPQSIITSSKNCPSSGSGSGSGPQPIIDKTCQAIDGRLSATCLYDKLLTAGCSDNGALAIALSGSPDPNDYISNLRNGDAVKIYNRVANPPLSLDVFSKGRTTVDIVLKQARQLADNTKQAPNSAIGASARDLCLQKGSLSAYNFCDDLPDTTLPPFDMGCIQQLFRKMGGQPVGTAYPSTSTINTYNSMGTLAAVKQYINQLISGLSSTDYNTQRNAMIQFLGISPEKLIKRAPYKQGVEVLWAIVNPGSSRIQGIIKRTIETDFVQFGGALSSSVGTITQIGINQYMSMMQLTDIRAPSDFSIKLSFTVDDGAWISINQPSTFDYTAEITPFSDQPGFVANNQIQGPSTYNFSSCQPFSGANPNIVKMFYNDAGGGGHTFNLNTSGCTGNPTMTPPYYSLTCESRAPFINFEVNFNNSNFEDTRNPGMFRQLCNNTSLEYHIKSDELVNIPGNKGFVRFDNSKSFTNIFNIAYQSWGTVTFAFRIQSMPVKDAIFSFWVYNRYCIFYLVPINGSTAQLRVRTNMTTNNSVYDSITNFTIQVGAWYFMEVAQNGSGFDVYCDTIDNIIKNNNFTTKYDKITNSGPITTPINNGLYTAGQYNCSIGIGALMSIDELYKGTSGFTFDIAWVHYFDFYINAADVVRECKASWIYTQFPNSFNTYKTI